MMQRFSFPILLAGMIVLHLTSAFGQTEKVLWSFGGTSTDGAFPATNLVRDKAGNLYGTTELGGSVGEGTIFELSPQSDGTYTESVLFNFCTNTIGQLCVDGYQPNSLIIDSAGNLYGTTYTGGGQDSGIYGGTIFELSPPKSQGGTWTYSVLYEFCYVVSDYICLDGANPHGRLTFD